MWDIAHQILVMVATLAILIAFHEAGHFWVARRCGVKVLRYSIGFGKTLVRWKDKQGCEYVLAALPLGGYVKMLDEREAPVADAEKPMAFNNQSVQKRIAIVSAGPLANFLLAIVVYWVVFLPGVTDLAPIVVKVQADGVAAVAGLRVGDEITAVDGEPIVTVQNVAEKMLQRIGDSGSMALTVRNQQNRQESIIQLPLQHWLSDVSDQVDVFGSVGFGFYGTDIAPIIGEVEANSAAAQAGLQVGDKLLRVDSLVLSDWRQWVTYVRGNVGKAMQVELVRAGQLHTVQVTPKVIKDKGKLIGLVGVRVSIPPVPAEYLRHQDYNPLSAAVLAVQRTWHTATFSLVSLKKMVMGDISYKQLSGPISIAKIASQSAGAGIYQYLSLLALLSVSLGVLNLLPIPVLDGGHIFFYVVEWLKGSPISERIQLVTYQLGTVLIVMIMLLAVVNDLGRL